MNSEFIIEIQKVLRLFHRTRLLEPNLSITRNEALYLRRKSKTNESFPPEMVLQEMIEMGLIISVITEVEELKLSDIAEKWIAEMEGDHNYQLLKVHKHYLARYFLKKWLLLEEVARMLAKFEMDGSGKWGVDIMDFSLSLPLKFITNMLQTLEVVKIEIDKCYLDVAFYDLIENKRKHGMLSEKVLLDKLDEQREVGLDGEKWVLEFERSRLRELWPNQQFTVKRVSEQDVSLGYDIHTKVYPYKEERFIEVKTTRSDRVQFFLSANELAMAREFGNKYWLYILVGKKKDRPPGQFFSIQNPYNFFKENDIVLEPCLFEVDIERNLLPDDPN